MVLLGVPVKASLLRISGLYQIWELLEQLNVAEKMFFGCIGLCQLKLMKVSAEESPCGRNIL